jgi:hypothetical protein
MNQLKRPFQITIINPSEVRMGSPYNICEIELENFDKVKIPKGGWQDIYAWSSDSKRLVLVKWDFKDNIPGFHLVLIDTEIGNTHESQRFYGLPNSISIEENKVKLNKFLHDKQKSSMGKLCCNINEEFEFTI